MLRVRYDYFWNTAGVLAASAVSPILLIAVTRVGGMADSGLFSYAFGIAVVLWVVSMWGGRSYQISDIEQSFSQHSYIFLRYALGALSVLVTIFFCLTNGYDNEKTAVILSFVCTKVVESIADSIYGSLQLNDQLDVVGKSLLAKATTGTLTFITLFITSKSLLASSIGLFATTLLITIFYDCLKARMFTKNHKNYIPKRIGLYLREAMQVMHKTAPIFVVSVLLVLSVNIPRYYVDKYHPYEVGFFGILAMFVTLMVLFGAFILQPKMVELARYYKTKKNLFFKSSIKIIKLVSIGGLAVLLLGSVFGASILTLLFGADFASYQGNIISITVGAIAAALCNVLVNILTVMRKFSVQIAVLLPSSLVLLVASMLLVPGRGITAAVNLFTITSIVQAFALLVYFVFLSQRVVARA